MSERTGQRWRRWRPWPDSLLGRIVLVMVAGEIGAQLAGSALWLHQQRSSARSEVLQSADQLARHAVSTIRNFSAMEQDARARAVEHLRGMGGTRFLILLGPASVELAGLASGELASAVTQRVRDALRNELPAGHIASVALAGPDEGLIPDNERRKESPPASWLRSTLLPQSRAAPQLVIQYPLEPGTWMFLATPLANPHFLNPANPFYPESVGWQLLTLLIFLLPAVWIVRSLVRPIDHIATAAQSFGNASVPTPIAETGTAELRRTARAFNGMLARIQGYLVDRERLFIGISHSLKTPIMRLKLRTELLDDEALRNDFHDDLDDLDMMVKSALQSLRDTDIHENLVPVRLDQLLTRLASRPIDPDASITLASTPVQVLGKPLALERALGSLLDNAVLYGKRARVRLSRQGQQALVEIRDFGPGIPAGSMEAVFAAHARLTHGKNMHRGGTGLGLGIAKNIVQAHHGELRLHNHRDGGLVVTVLLPALCPPDI